MLRLVDRECELFRGGGQGPEEDPVKVGQRSRERKRARVSKAAVVQYV